MIETAGDFNLIDVKSIASFLERSFYAKATTLPLGPKVFYLEVFILAVLWQTEKDV